VQKRKGMERRRGEDPPENKSQTQEKGLIEMKLREACIEKGKRF